MEQQAIHNYLVNFFTLNKCEIKENESGKLTVTLNEDLDRLLMNRPFYWEYIKKIGQEGTPATLTFLSSPDRREEKGEWIHFGSPRLHQIFQSQLQQGRFTMQYEQTNRSSLQPWLVSNIRISYKGRQKKDEILSIGLQLINGTMVFNFMELIQDLSFSSVIPDYCYTISPIIRITSGYKRIENYIQQYIDSQKHEWAEDAFNHFNKEKEILNHFYESYLAASDEEDKEELTTRYQNELDHLQKRLMPEIQVETINGGLFYLSEETKNQVIKGLH
ncbi:YqhG family protein [Salinibacillus xinjiangensis]|uniref:YqhG family protein n=1 Tax=Salinibacillus xinjiangensis TaxID=1229268 RepID=A0A6G1X6D9_9BACI|nr:YqhG family protein [Salinibacillus xinjiangensis]MRG86571.1 hypothetical protein [Salinibacillus xinjiangensis]